MPWVVGIDEAGYGPNLGPLVQACVALYLPEDDLSGWETTREIFRRSNETKDDRLVVDDSKKVYTHGGFEELERTVLAITLPIMTNQQPPVIHNLFTMVSPHDNHFSNEYWYQGDALLVDESRIKVNQIACDKWMNWLTKKNVGKLLYQVHVVMPDEFNKAVDLSGSKATVLADGIIRFLQHIQEASQNPNVPNRDSPVIVTCDKLGGRNFYAPILQEAFPDGWPVAVVEGAAESRYRILNVGRDITVSFKPRADGENVCVALASMLAKYVREVCMKQFNQFWAKHVPGIKPTAGYPVDAKRFFSEIQSAMKALGLPADAVWRKK